MTSSQTHPFRFRFRVRYSECDAQGVVFNARYAEYVDIAVNEYIRSLFGDYQRMLENDRDVQVVSLAINWKSSARFDDVLEAQISPGQIGNTSFVLHLQFMRYRDDTPIADASITYVMVRPSLMEKVRIDGIWRDSLAAGAGGVLVSHAGESEGREPD